MTDTANILSLLQAQLSGWPEANAQDLTKALYQAEFGCGHFVSDRARGLQYLIDEQRALACAPRKAEPPFIEPLGPSYCRIHISHMQAEGLSAETLFALFSLSAEAPSGDMSDFRKKLDCMEEAAASGTLPLDAAQTAAFLSQYRAAGCPSTHHSEAFRAAYAPAYRVIRADYARFLPLFCAIDRLMKTKDQVTVAIEGGSASGKSTLGDLLQNVYSANLFHMDDFFLQPHQRTPERFREIGGNVDYERFLEEVLKPLAQGRPFAYRVFDCSEMALGDTVEVQPNRLNIIEGAYSMHPKLCSGYDLSCFIAIDPDEQSERILRRNGPVMQQRFLNEWIPLEKRYFEGADVKARCTLIL